MKGKYEANGEEMIQYLIAVQALLVEFLSWNIAKISRVENFKAVRLSKSTSMAILNLKRSKEKVFV